MSDVDDVLASLSSPRFSLATSLPALPARHGLYAIYGDESASETLKIGPGAGGALYVGKSEDNLWSRDIGTHFGDGRTGSSTVRRSFAALLRHPLSLTGMPRNPERPGHFANYGLSSDDESKLTRWMREHLEIALWPSDGALKLDDIESEVLRRWNPTLNILGVEHRGKERLKAERKAMADQARSWKRGT